MTLQTRKGYICSTTAWASAECLTRRGKVDILLILFRLLTMQCKWTFIHALPYFPSQGKCPISRRQSQNLCSVGSSASFSLTHLSHSTKLRGLAYCYQQLLPRCITLQERLRSTDTCGKTPTASGHRDGRPWNLKFDILLLIF